MPDINDVLSTLDNLIDAVSFGMNVPKDEMLQALNDARAAIAIQNSDLADLQVTIDDLHDRLMRATSGDPRTFGGF